jgi:hypothetical protein
MTSTKNQSQNKSILINTAYQFTSINHINSGSKCTLQYTAPSTYTTKFSSPACMRREHIEIVDFASNLFIHTLLTLQINTKYNHALVEILQMPHQ